MALLRLFGFFTDDNKLDEKTGMTEKQKRLVQNTWGIIRKDEVTSGVAVMLALFTQYPETRKEFRLFKDMPLDELPKNKRFQAHCANVISTFSSAIDYVRDPELMEASLLSLIERHKARGQTRQHFENLRLVLENLYPTIFGKQYTPEVKEAWKKMFDYVFAIFYRVYDE